MGVWVAGEVDGAVVLMDVAGVEGDKQKLGIVCCDSANNIYKNQFFILLPD